MRKRFTIKQMHAQHYGALECGYVSYPNMGGTAIIRPMTKQFVMGLFVVRNETMRLQSRHMVSPERARNKTISCVEATSA